MSSHPRGALGGLKQPDEIDEVFGRAHPNPERIGCPSHDVLVSLARREVPMGDPAYGHLAECSPCYLEVRVLKQTADSQRRRRLLWAAAAALILTTASAGWFVATRQDGVPADRVQVRAQLDLRPYAITRGEPQRDLPFLSVPQGDLRLTLFLPTGSESGSYTIEIRDLNGAPRASGRGNAEVRNYVSTLEVAIGLADLPKGEYTLALRRDNHAWQLFTLHLQ